MTPRDESDGTPSVDEALQDFTVPGDADLRPVVDGHPVAEQKDDE
jgi:hypothetical protein